jgi:hypothetical protein
MADDEVDHAWREVENVLIQSSHKGYLLKSRDFSALNSLFGPRDIDPRCFQILEEAALAHGD